jgi:hypothetical protein
VTTWPGCGDGDYGKVEWGGQEGDDDRVLVAQRGSSSAVGTAVYGIEGPCCLVEWLHVLKTWLI